MFELHALARDETAGRQAQSAAPLPAPPPLFRQASSGQAEHVGAEALDRLEVPAHGFHQHRRRRGRRLAPPADLVQHTEVLLVADAHHDGQRKARDGASQRLRVEPGQIGP